MLEFNHVCKRDGVDPIFEDLCLQLDASCINILLGPTLSGKTSLMRMMAGLDKPDSGDIRFNGESVLGVSVRKRNVAMVYQQFINYPSLSVYENIASPLRVAKLPKDEIQSRVTSAAQLLKISDFLARTPAELSGGQQQRVALARALVKRADLVLLDEPLANLDYKLREELRAELPQMFREQGALLVYATTEPTEALLLGGNTVVLHEGAIAQFGPTTRVYRHPSSLTSARAFSDPPLNTVRVEKRHSALTLDQQIIPLAGPAAVLNDSAYDLGVRPHHLTLRRGSEHDIEIQVSVTVNEISGSESFIHFSFMGQYWVALVHGIQAVQPGQVLALYMNPQHFYYFHAGGDTALVPSHEMVA